MSAAKSGFAAQWRAAAAGFAARTRREKLILAAAALALVFVAFDSLWLTPSWNALKARQTGFDQKRGELAQLVAQAAALAEQQRQRAAAVEAALTRARRDVEDVSGQLAAFERTLVPARQMADFLRGLMPPTAVEVVGLKTLPPVPLIARPAGKDGEAAKADGAKSANLYKHGVEITLAGSYPALLDYLARLEAAPRKVLWGRLDLRVEKHPTSELKLVLYTLSLDPAWLAV